MVLKAMRNEFFALMGEGARAHHARRQAEYELLVQGIDGETDVAAQERLVVKLIEQRVHALVIVPADSNAMLPVLLKALKAGVLVVNLDNKLDDRALATAGVNIPFVGPSNFQGSRSVGDYVAKQLPRASRVGIIEGPPGSINAKARSDGFRAAIAAAGLRLAAVRSGHWTQTQGRAAASELMRLAPDIKALLCGNDNMALGAVQALRELGRSSDVLVCGYDNIPSVRPLIAQGLILATADQFPVKQAEYALDVVLKALQTGQRQTELPSIIQSPVQLVTRS
ncbi:substrate-binding domain-containing protein [Paucibacter sp. PLA-PC-4]|uniref:substrate-binding domain-containing protein n=1 Tax=Paucibacter sp. PLA-PC-4 TaxID=2993655 RepID=UPI00224AF975|nr:substrate-binding domain-containing protein [Paucibacter sp. PLA-PC-4]MCX2865265.1 substrate-binding domain-containing protein [Paucibacter sp. PLA-PC-4]